MCLEFGYRVSGHIERLQIKIKNYVKLVSFERIDNTVIDVTRIILFNRSLYNNITSMHVYSTILN
jgi:hypothetical protein